MALKYEAIKIDINEGHSLKNTIAFLDELKKVFTSTFGLRLKDSLQMAKPADNDSVVVAYWFSHPRYDDLHICITNAASSSCIQYLATKEALVDYIDTKSNTSTNTIFASTNAKDGQDVKIVMSAAFAGNAFTAAPYSSLPNKGIDKVRHYAPDELRIPFTSAARTVYMTYIHTPTFLAFDTSTTNIVVKVSKIWYAKAYYGDRETYFSMYDGSSRMIHLLPEEQAEYNQIRKELKVDEDAGFPRAGVNLSNYIRGASANRRSDMAQSVPDVKEKQMLLYPLVFDGGGQPEYSYGILRRPVTCGYVLRPNMGSFPTEFLSLSGVINVDGRYYFVQYLAGESKLHYHLCDLND